MLCSECSENHLGNDCPLCGLPTHVKDAQVNRQLSNMVRLCRELRGLVTATGPLKDEGYMETRLRNGCHGNVTNGNSLQSVYDFTCTPVRASKNRGGQRNRRPVNYCEMETSELNENETSLPNQRTPQNSSIRAANRGRSNSSYRPRTGQKWRSSSGLFQTTMTQLFDDVSENHNPVTPRAKRRDGKVLKTPVRSKSQTPRQIRGNNSGQKGSQLCKTQVHLSNSFCTMSPQTPSSSRKRHTDPMLKKNAKGETPLHVAVIKGDVERVGSLLGEGANPNARDNAGWTPLHEACNHGYTDIAELLLNNGALINTPGMENDSPLHDAVSNNRLDCVRLLVSRGASQTARNVYGQTVQDIAISEEMKAALQTQVCSSPTHTPTSTPEAVLKELRSHEPVVLLGTALSRDQKIILHKAAAILKARVEEDFVPEVTHLVTSSNQEGQCPRTLKYLRAILTGKWVLNMEWVKMCIEYSSRVSEEPFEVSGSTPNPDTQAATRGRSNEEHQLPRLFDGCKFYFSGTFEHPTPDVTELIQLVRCGGGTVLSREPKLQTLDKSSLTVPYHASPDSPLKDCGIYVIHDNRAEFQPIRSPHLCSVTVSWLMDSIASFKLLDLS
ncbi:BRCA1-associated RING domain protein 1-like [Liolophura sinensis]|uniref:BRCA1-associated RING domain protein 1-like n=1 Tax=Liolophura sinensis TaxID=3198878 RepID=UPI003158BE9B